VDGEQVRRLAASLGAECIETHISWVLLAGDDAWKIKKPVRMPFVDYGTLAARRRCCEEEVRLNSRLAPGLYLGVDDIAGTNEAPQLGGPGTVLEVAVHMRRFAQEDLFSARLRAGRLGPGEVDALSALIAGFHAGSPVALPSSGFGTPARRRETALAAFDGAARWLEDPASAARLKAWIEEQASALAPLWQARRLGGRVRHVHGDLHLDNVVLVAGVPVAFDAIEFDPALNCIDVLDDVAFTVMDFAARGSRAFAFRLLNHWLDALGEHAALPALRFAIAYRALVRAQVAGLRGDATLARAYAGAACEWTRPGRPRLCITHGLPGSGKTWRSQAWLEGASGIRVRSDVERKRLAGLPPLADSRTAGLDLYTPAMTRQTYSRLFALAATALRAGHPVVLDAAFLRRSERDEARALAAALRVPFSILDCDAPDAVLRERLAARRGDASEADARVLDRLRAAAEPLDAAERESANAK
jgi:aminoglycoside phosphotransferase family enzyme/predicted kinase